MQLPFPVKKVSSAMDRFRQNSDTLTLGAVYRQLTSTSKYLLIFRFITNIISISFCIALILGPHVNSYMNMAKINCSRLMVAEGLYNSLRNSVSSTTYGEFEGSGGLPEDAALTDLEIGILTAYTEAQVSLSSQFILVNLWTWCKGYYNVTKLEDDHDGSKPKYHRERVYIDCVKGGYSTNVLDYRAQMVQSGYSIIMAYALQSTSYSDNSYLKRTNLRKTRLRAVPSALIYGACANLVALVFTLVIYGSKRSKNGLDKVPTFLWKIVSLLALSAFLAILVATVTAMVLLNNVADEVHTLLGDFNVSYSLTTVWVALLWTTFAVSLFHALSWLLPLWCANPNDNYDENEMDEAYYMPKYDNSRKTSRPKRTSRAVSAIFSNTDAHLLLSDVKSNANHSDGYDSDYTARSITEKKPKYRPAQKLLAPNYDMHSDDEMDRELLKLGERLARKPSVRFLNVKTRNKKHSKLKDMLNLSDTRDLLYGDHHQQSGPYNMDDSDDRFRLLSTNSIKRKPKMQVPIITVVDDEGSVFADNNAIPEQKKPQTSNHARDSILNEDEINVLEMNSHLNQLH